MNKEDIIISHTKKILEAKKNVIIAIDGRCASGKTTLADAFSKRIGCNVIHTDDFFLRPNQRTESRLSETGGNIDYERFIEEVIEPLEKGTDFSYRPYFCRTAELGEPIHINSGKITLIEGAYSCHPKFAHIYDLKFFLDVAPDEQIERIKRRNGEDMLEKFKRMWIPMEEKYFSEFKIKETCELL